LKATAPERYRVQLTIGPETHDKLRRLQELLRPEIPSGDPAAIFDRAITRLLEDVEKRKCGAAASVIRPGADKTETTRRATRTIPRAVRKAVWLRDGGQCAFVSRKGRRCTERHFLHYHHRIPHALGGPATVDNISLRCRLHNQYESDLVFGRRETRGQDETQRRGSGTTSTDWQPSIPCTVAHTV
jgi:5-methylcytosine-specific restriction endonuclease McrA